MPSAARLLALLAAIFFLGACSHFNRLTPAPHPLSADAPLPPDALRPSKNLLVGRVIALDAARGFAFVELTAAPPAAALADSAELITRTDDLRETARLRTSRYVRGRTLGTRIISGQPSPGDEVVFRAP